MIIDMKKEEFIEKFDAFEVKHYTFNLLQYFKKRVDGISRQIGEIKLNSKLIVDNGTQVDLSD